MNRRQFLTTSAAGLAGLTRTSRARAGQAAPYDLVIRGGRGIDPSTRLDTIADVGNSSGRIAGVERNLSADATEVLDARGKLVVPGLIDIHTHCGRSADGPGLVLQDGVTGWIDAGSQGADHIADVVAIARKAQQQCR